MLTWLTRQKGGGARALLILAEKGGNGGLTNSDTGFMWKGHFSIFLISFRIRLELNLLREGQRGHAWHGFNTS